MYIKVKKNWQLVFDFAMILLGTILMGFSFSIFLEPNNISTGGFSGLAMIVNTLLNLIGIHFLNTSVIYFLLNIGLFLYAFKALGKRFAIKAFAGIVFYSIAMELCSLIPITITFEPLISALYGGILMGVGIGIVVRFGGSTGGGDMVASIVRNKNPKASIGMVVIIIDAIVLVLSLFVFNNGIEVMPYTIIALVISSLCTDFVNDGYKQVRAYHIISNNGREIANRFMNELSRGCTLTRAEGMHSHIDKDYLICLISKFQAGTLHKIVKEVDPSAFVYSTKVTEVMGTWSSTEELNEEKFNKDNDKKKLSKEKSTTNSTIKENSEDKINANQIENTIEDKKDKDLPQDTTNKKKINKKIKNKDNTL